MDGTANIPIETIDVLSTEPVSMYSIDDIYTLLLHTQETLDKILAVILILIAVKFLWTLFDKWLFGGC